MTQIDLEDWLTSSAEDTPASRSHKPGSASAIKMTDISGQRCLQLSRLSGPLGLLEKMLLDTSLWASTRCYLTWKAQATPAGATLFRLSPQTPRTDETDAGLLHTPTATANQMAPSMNSGWWPTPTANEDAAGTPNGKMQRQLGNHPDIRGNTPEEWKRGQLNPNWVEWLMGYPVGYTDLNS